MKFVFKPPRRNDFQQTRLKNEEQLYITLLALIKDLTLKDKNRVILAGPFSHESEINIFSRIMLLHKKASKKWQPIYDASRIGQEGS